MADATKLIAETKRVAAMAESAATLKRLAESGNFAVDDTTGNQLIASLEGVIDTLQSRWDALQKLGQSPQMSETATGKWVASHMLNTASDEQGLLTQLQAAKQEFPTYIEAIKLAKQNYRDSDTASRTALKRVPNEQT